MRTKNKILALSLGITVMLTGCNMVTYYTKGTEVETGTELQPRKEKEIAMNQKT